MFMKIFRIALSAAAIAALSLSGSLADEGPPCGPRTALTKKLEQAYGETRQGVGVTGKNAVFEIWTSEKTGSWTLLLTRPNGSSCVMAVGEGWQSMKDLQAGLGDPA